MIEENGDDKIRKGHSCENQSSQCAERPERHLEFAFRFLGVIHSEDKANRGNDNAEGAETSENDEKHIVGQRRLLFLGRKLEAVL